MNQGSNTANLICCLLVVILMLLKPHHAQGNQHNTIVLNCGDTFDVTGSKVTKPLHTLAQAVKSKHQTRYFRVVWTTSTPNMAGVFTVLYDRSNQTLRYFSKTQIGGLGNERVPTQHHRFRLSKVSALMIIRLSRNHKNSMEDPGDSYFSSLTQLGAKRF